jgi:hypothetical protein
MEQYYFHLSLVLMFAVLAGRIWWDSRGKRCPNCRKLERVTVDIWPVPGTEVNGSVLRMTSDRRLELEKRTICDRHLSYRCKNCGYEWSEVHRLPSNSKQCLGCVVLVLSICLGMYIGTVLGDFLGCAWGALVGFVISMTLIL